VLANDLRDRARADEVVHDSLTRMPVEYSRGDDRGGRRATHGLSGIVDEEHAIRVAVEGEAYVGADIEHGALEVFEVLELDRIRGVIGEGAVEIAVENGERERQSFEHLRHHEAAHAVRGVGDDHERFQRGDVYERTHVIAEGLEEVDVLDPARDLAARGHTGRDHLLDLREAGLLAHRRGAGPAELDAVVLRRIVAGREHRAGRIELARREVDDVGGAKADVGHIRARERRTLDEGRGERHRRRPHVVTDDHLLGSGEVRERVADLARERLIDLIRVNAANVVSLEDGVERHTNSCKGKTPETGRQW